LKSATQHFFSMPPPNNLSSRHKLGHKISTVFLQTHPCPTPRLFIDHGREGQSLVRSLILFSIIIYCSWEELIDRTMIVRQMSTACRTNWGLLHHTAAAPGTEVNLQGTGDKQPISNCVFKIRRYGLVSGLAFNLIMPSSH
jgi:hypothetical protein